MALSIQTCRFPTFKQVNQDQSVERQAVSSFSVQSSLKLSPKGVSRHPLSTRFTMHSVTTEAGFQSSDLFGDAGAVTLFTDATEISSSKGVCSKNRMGKRRHCQWKMEVADPMENFCDSFGNECPAERRARQELETSESYKKLTVAMGDMNLQMQEFVSKELYEDAAEVRDTLNMLEFRKRLLELSAKPRVLYRVGDVIVHRRYGYRGVIYGHDVECSAPNEWKEAMKVDSLPEGREQPFYHVLVDSRDRPGGVSTYVAQENLALHRLGRSVLHSWIPKFFVGFQDGTYLPRPMLRRLYPNDW